MKHISLLLGVLLLTAATGVAQQTTASDQSKPASLSENANTETLVNRYFESLNEPDQKRRLELTKQVWAEKGKFGTPYEEVAGWEAIDALIGRVLKTFPAATVRRTTRIDGFGNYLRWGFTLSEANGTPILSGTDFAIIENGKLQLVMGFFDFAPRPGKLTTPERK